MTSQWRRPIRSAAMHDPMYMLVNLAIGGPAGTPSNGLANGSEMYIDYIRAYALRDTPALAATEASAGSDWHI